MNTMNKVVKVICKVLEILFWLADAAFAITFVYFLLAANNLFNLVSPVMEDASLPIMGFEISLISSNGEMIKGAVAISLLVGVVTAALVAMIFRNVYLIYNVSEGKSKHSVGATPFQPENVRMIKEIGIFAIAIPVSELIASVIAILVVGSEYVELSVSMTSLIFGFIVLSLSQYFAYGAKLQEEVDGLL